MTGMFVEGGSFERVFEVTPQVYEAFQACSGDMNPLHTEEAFATGKGFAGRVMYGNILNCFLSCFIGMHLPTQDVIIHSQQIDFKRPVYMGDRLTLTAKVDGVFESVKAVTFRFRFVNADGVTVASGKFQIGVLL